MTLCEATDQQTRGNDRCSHSTQVQGKAKKNKSLSPCPTIIMDKKVDILKNMILVVVRLYLVIAEYSWCILINSKYVMLFKYGIILEVSCR